MVMEDGETAMKSAVDEIKHLVEVQLQVFDHAKTKYLTSIAKAIQAVIPCGIYFKPDRHSEFKNQAQTWSRVAQVTADWPDSKVFYKPEHFVIYDETMKPSAATRCIGHELFHILAHNPTAKERATDEKWRVKYSEAEEKQADVFSLLLLKNRVYLMSRPAPIDDQQLINLINGEAGRPSYLNPHELQQVVPLLDWPAAKKS